ncbi:MAG TPA: hypothetical protein PLR25_26135, partial [Planctomycetaceae bacterium]|nr:hypothetical protein [Planctomycetaceae bacterium]
SIRHSESDGYFNRKVSAIRLAPCRSLNRQLASTPGRKPSCIAVRLGLTVMNEKSSVFSAPSP